MSIRTAAPSCARWSVGAWALLLSVTAGALAAILGIHALGDNAFADGTRAASSATSTAVGAAASDADAVAPLSVGDGAASGVADPGEALACSLLALLCAATLAFALARMRRVPARALDPVVPPSHPGPSTWSLFRSEPVSLTVLGISRI